MSDAPSGALAGLLAARHRERRSGILTASRGRLRRLFCLDEGYLVFTRSNLLEEQFGEFLIHRGLLAPSDRVTCSAQAQSSGCTLAQVLESRQLVSSRVLQQAMEAQIRGLLSSCLEWPDGRYRFESGRARLAGEPLAHLSPLAAILDHTQRHPASLDALRSRIGNPDLVLERTPAADSLPDDGNDARQYLLEACDGVRPLAALISTSPEDEEATLRALYGLLLVGAVGAVRDEEAEDEALPLASREELLARLDRAESADHYLLLGIEHDADREQIRTAYYGLARRLHPDRFRAGEMTDLLARVEAYFTQVTEAYNTLIDPEGRRAYDKTLEEGEAAAKKGEPAGDTQYLARRNFLRGRALVDRRRLQDALRFFENAVELDPTRAEYRLALGTLLSQNPRMRDEAEKQLLRAAELEPTSTGAYLALGGLYHRAGRRDEARRMFEEVLRWEPGNTDALELLREI